MAGTPDTRLVVLRGNSGSGKSSVAAALQRRRRRGEVAVVSQDVVRRQVLWARDTPGNPSIGLIDLTARYVLDAGISVVVEGILHPDRYADMLAQLVRDHRGQTRTYFWDLRFEETLRRHATRAKTAEFGEADMRDWWYGAARIPVLHEETIGPEWSMDAAVRCIEADCGWA